jgi:hypothetical protein
MRDVRQRVPHVALLVPALSPDLAPCQRWLGVVRRLMFCKFAFRSGPPKGESIRQVPARKAPVPRSNTGLDQVHGGQGRGLRVSSPTVTCAVSHLRLSVHSLAWSGQIGSSLRRTRMLRMLRAHGLGRSFEKARRGSRTMHGMTPIERSEKILPSHVRRLTTTCSELDHHKVHAPGRHHGLRLSDCALQVGRPVADVGCWATAI